MYYFIIGGHMKILTLVLALLFVSFTFTAIAKESPDKNCTSENHCVADSNFTAKIGKIRKRGKFILLQVNYHFTNGGFTVNYKDASLIDSLGNEATIKKIEHIRVSNSGGKKNLSLKFKAEGFEWSDTFDLEIKADSPHGSIAFFDLKTK